MFYYYSNRPNTNEYKFEDKYIIEVILPGHEKENLTVEITSSKLTITSKPQKQSITGLLWKDEDYIVKPIKISYSLPKDASIKNISSSFNNGILKVEIPKKEAEEKHTIEIQ